MQLTKNVSITQREYRELLEKKLRYERMRAALEEDPFAPPPTRDADAVVDAFEKTKKYSRAFLASLGRGLRRSTHFHA